MLGARVYPGLNKIIWLSWHNLRVFSCLGIDESHPHLPYGRGTGHFPGMELLPGHAHRQRLDACHAGHDVFHGVQCMTDYISE